jgi:hypothetical protein
LVNILGTSVRWIEETYVETNNARGINGAVKIKHEKKEIIKMAVEKI